MKYLGTILSILLLFSGTAGALGVDNRILGQLLAKHVKDGRVDYDHPAHLEGRLAQERDRPARRRRQAAMEHEIVAALIELYLWPEFLRQVSPFPPQLL